MRLAELQLIDPMFFGCGFCQAVAPKGNHVCGDKYTLDRLTVLRIREQKEKCSARTPGDKETLQFGPINESEVLSSTGVWAGHNS